ncbi:MAG: PaaX family transcriptional regulator [Vulcanimicrobiaceae bacterium]
MWKRTVSRPTSFIYTIMGDLVRYYGGEVWIGSLTRLMAEFGVSEPAVRQAVSRMSRQGWIGARKIGNRSYYAMTDRGRERVDKVSPRIYLPPVTSWDGKWRILAYTIPEQIRDSRDRLRKDLTVLGFAPLTASLWISPRDVLDGGREAAGSQGLLPYIDLFLAESRGPRSDRELLQRAWNVAAIAKTYRDFIAFYTKRLERFQEQLPKPPLADAHAFAEREWVVHDFRKFVYLDPGLPAALLPGDWPATRASALFRSYYEVVKPRALQFFESIFEAPPDRRLIRDRQPDPFETLLHRPPG